MVPMANVLEHLQGANGGALLTPKFQVPKIMWIIIYTIYGKGVFIYHRIMGIQFEVYYSCTLSYHTIYWGNIYIYIHIHYLQHGWFQIPAPIQAPTFDIARAARTRSKHRRKA